MAQQFDPGHPVTALKALLAGTKLGAGLDYRIESDGRIVLTDKTSGETLGLNLEQTKYNGAGGSNVSVRSEKGGSARAIAPLLLVQMNRDTKKVNVTGQSSMNTLSTMVEDSKRIAARDSIPWNTAFQRLLHAGDTQLGYSPSSSIPNNTYEEVRARKYQAINVRYGVYGTGIDPNKPAQPFQLEKKMMDIHLAREIDKGGNRYIENAEPNQAAGVPGITWGALKKFGMYPDEKSRLIPSSVTPEGNVVEGKVWLDRTAGKYVKAPGVGYSDKALPYQIKRDNQGRITNVSQIEPGIITDNHVPGWALGNVLTHGESMAVAKETRAVVIGSPGVPGAGYAYHRGADVSPDLWGRKASATIGFEGITPAQLARGDAQLQIDDIINREYGEGRRNVERIGKMTIGGEEQDLKMRLGATGFIPQSVTMHMPKWVDSEGKPVTDYVEGRNYQSTEGYAKTVQDMYGINVQRNSGTTFGLEIGGIMHSDTAVKGDVKISEIATGLQNVRVKTDAGEKEVSHFTGDIKSPKFFLNAVMPGMSRGQLSRYFSDFAKGGGEAEKALFKHFKQNYSEDTGGPVDLDMEEMASIYREKSGGTFEGTGAELAFKMFEKNIYDKRNDKAANRRNLKLYNMGGVGGRRVPISVWSPDNIKIQQEMLRRNMPDASPEQVQDRFLEIFRPVHRKDRKGFEAAVRGQGEFGFTELEQKLGNDDLYIGQAMLHRRIEYSHRPKMKLEFRSGLTSAFPELAKFTGVTADDIALESPQQRAALGALKAVSWQTERLRNEAMEGPSGDGVANISEMDLAGMSGYINSMKGHSKAEIMKGITERFSDGADEQQVWRLPGGAYMMSPQAATRMDFNELGIDASQVSSSWLTSIQRAHRLASDDEKRGALTDQEFQDEMSRAVNPNYNLMRKIITGTGEYFKRTFSTENPAIISGKYQFGTHLQAGESALPMPLMKQFSRQLGMGFNKLLRSGFDTVSARFPQLMESHMFSSKVLPLLAQVRRFGGDYDRVNRMLNDPRWKSSSMESLAFSIVHAGDYDKDLKLAMAGVRRVKGKLETMEIPENRLTNEKAFEMERKLFGQGEYANETNAQFGAVGDINTGLNTFQKLKKGMGFVTYNDLYAAGMNNRMSKGLRMGIGYNMRRDALGYAASTGIYSEKEMQQIATVSPWVYQGAGLDRRGKWNMEGGDFSGGVPAARVMSNSYMMTDMDKEGNATGRPKMFLAGGGSFERRSTTTPSGVELTPEQGAGQWMDVQNAMTNPVAAMSVYSHVANQFAMGAPETFGKNTPFMSEEQYASHMALPGDFDELAGRLKDKEHHLWAREAEKYMEERVAGIPDRNAQVQQILTPVGVGGTISNMIRKAITKQGDDGSQQVPGALEAAAIMRQEQPDLYKTWVGGAYASEFMRRAKGSNLALFQPSVLLANTKQFFGNTGLARTMRKVSQYLTNGLPQSLMGRKIPQPAGTPTPQQMAAVPAPQPLPVTPQPVDVAQGKVQAALVTQGVPGGYTDGFDNVVRPIPGNDRLEQVTEPSGRTYQRPIMGHNSIDPLAEAAISDPNFIKSGAHSPEFNAEADAANAAINMDTVAPEAFGTVPNMPAGAIESPRQRLVREYQELTQDKSNIHTHWNDEELAGEISEARKLKTNAQRKAAAPTKMQQAGQAAVDDIEARKNEVAAKLAAFRSGGGQPPSGGNRKPPSGGGPPDDPKKPGGGRDDPLNPRKGLKELSVEAWKNPKAAADRIMGSYLRIKGLENSGMQGRKAVNEILNNMGIPSTNDEGRQLHTWGRMSLAMKQDPTRFMEEIGQDSQMLQYVTGMADTASDINYAVAVGPNAPGIPEHVIQQFRSWNAGSGIGAEVEQLKHIKFAIGKSGFKKPRSVRQASMMEGTQKVTDAYDAIKAAGFLDTSKGVDVNAWKDFASENQEALGVVSQARKLIGTETSPYLPTKMGEMAQLGNVLHKQDTTALKEGEGWFKIPHDELKKFNDALDTFHGTLKSLNDVQGKVNSTEKERVAALTEYQKAAVALRAQDARIASIGTEQEIDQLGKKMNAKGYVARNEDAEKMSSLVKKSSAAQTEYETANNQLLQMQQEKEGGLGTFARKMLGGFGLMYMKSIWGLATNGLGYGQQERMGMDQGNQMAAAQVFGSRGVMANQQQQLANQMALSGGNYSLLTAGQSLGARNPLLREVGSSVISGISAWGIGQYALQEGMGMSQGAAGRIAVPLGLAIGAGSLFAQGYERSQDQNSLAFRKSRTGIGAYSFVDDIAGSMFTNRSNGEIMKPGEDYHFGYRTGSDFDKLQRNMEFYGKLRQNVEGGGVSFNQMQQAYGKGGGELFGALSSIYMGAVGGDKYAPEAHQRAVSVFARSSGINQTVEMEQKLAGDFMNGIGTDQMAQMGLNALGINQYKQLAQGADKISLVDKTLMALMNGEDMTDVDRSIFASGAEFAAQVPGLKRQRNVKDILKQLDKGDASGLKNLMRQYGEMSGTRAGDVYLSQAQAAEAAKMAGIDYAEPRISDFYVGGGRGRGGALADIDPQVAAFQMAQSSAVMSQAQYRTQTAQNQMQRSYQFGNYATGDAAYKMMMQATPGQEWSYNRALSGDPMMMAVASQRGFNLGGAPGLATLNGSTLNANYAAFTDTNLNGQLTGLSWGTTSFNLGNFSGGQMANRMFGSNWQTNGKFDQKAIRAGVEGYQLPGAMTMPDGTVIDRVGGQMGMGLYASEMQMNQQLAQASLQSRGLESDITFQRSMWGIEDKQRALSHANTMWGFDFQARGIDQNVRQFGENRAIEGYQMQIQRGWNREDWGYQDQTRNMQWSWKQEDFQEEARFMTGRQRKLAERQMKRDTTMHNMEEDQIEKGRGRQEELWKLEDERFKLQKKHFDEGVVMQREQLEHSKKYYLENKKLEDAKIKLQREHWEEEMKLQKESIKLTQSFAKEQHRLNVTMAQTSQSIQLMEGSFNTLTDDAFEGLRTSVAASIPLFKELAEYFDRISQADTSPITSAPTVATPSLVGSNAEYYYNLYNNKSAEEVEKGMAMANASTTTNSWDYLPVGNRSSEQGQEINIYVGNEKLGTFVVDTVNREIRA